MCTPYCKNINNALDLKLHSISVLPASTIFPAILVKFLLQLLIIGKPGSILLIDLLPDVANIVANVLLVLASMIGQSLVIEH